MRLSLPPIFSRGWEGGSVNKVRYGLGENGQFSKNTADMILLCGSSLWVCGRAPKPGIRISEDFSMVLFRGCCKIKDMILNFEPVDEILEWDHSDQTPSPSLFSPPGADRWLQLSSLWVFAGCSKQD